MTAGIATVESRDRSLTAASPVDTGVRMSTDLVAALKQKDPLAFEQLLAQHGAMLYRVAIRLVRQREEAEEVVQETLLTVYEKIHTFDEQAALSTWLYRIVTNHALMRLRARGREREVPLEPGGPECTEEGQMARDVADWDLSPEDTLLRQEAVTVLRQAVNRLPEAYRAVYVLTEITGLPRQEVATMLELTAPTVKGRLQRARLFLREALLEYLSERDAYGSSQSIRNQLDIPTPLGTSMLN